MVCFKRQDSLPVVSSLVVLGRNASGNQFEKSLKPLNIEFDREAYNFDIPSEKKVRPK
jgi:hypothetical protein